MPSSDNYTKQKRINKRNPRILISRTDNIGDVVLALPMIGALKKAIPGAFIMFMGKPYTEDIINLSQDIDKFVDWEKIKKQTKHAQVRSFKKLKADYIVHALAVKQIAVLAKKAGIPKRIGSTGRWYHWFTCNKLILMSRRRSRLHEAQLNIKLLSAFGINRSFSLSDVIDNYQVEPPNILPDVFREMIAHDKFNLILHPKSKGSAREWGLENYSNLISILPPEKFRIFITGTADDTQGIHEKITSRHPSVIDLSGKLTLLELISFIANADGMVACSTGPLHIAAALDKYAIGIYPPIKPMHPVRWAPLGANASFLVSEKKCNKCRYSSSCECIESITPDMVKKRLMEVFKTEPLLVDII